MPKKSRIDAPDALHHVMVRGIDRQNIFDDQKDYVTFLDRLGGLLVPYFCLGRTRIKSPSSIFRRLQMERMASRAWSQGTSTSRRVMVP